MDICAIVFGEKKKHLNFRKFLFFSLIANVRITFRKLKVEANLVPRAFLRRGEDGREKTLASADHVIFKHLEKLGVINHI